MKKIAVFKPYNAQLTNAFGTGQYPVFKEINKYKGYDVTFFLSDTDIYFDGVTNRYIKENKFITSVLRIYRKVFGVFYVKIPFYNSIKFDDYDVIITEGLHYCLLKYFENYAGKLIINDSITAVKKLEELDSRLINKLFIKSICVVVNEKIPVLYRKNGIFLSTRVIGHTIQLNKIEFTERFSAKPKLLSVGRLVEEKGYIYIFDAIKQLAPLYPDLVIDIYGDGPLLEMLENYIKENNLSEHVFMKGFVPYEHITQLFSNYSIFISHPIEMDHVAEAFHMGNMEAMASGVPVITTDCGGIPFTVQDKAIVCRQRNITDIVQSIEDLLNNKKFVNRMSLDGRANIEKKYDIDTIVQKWINVIDE